MMKQTLNEFAEQPKVRYLHEVTAANMDRHMAWVIGHSPTKSARTGWNKFLRILQFLNHNDAIPMVGMGKSIRPVGMRDAPRFVEKEVITNKPEELRSFSIFVTAANWSRFRPSIAPACGKWNWRL